MTFHSILYRDAHADLAIEQTEAPEFFHDLNIDQLVAGVTGKGEYDLKPFSTIDSAMSTRSLTGRK